MFEQFDGIGFVESVREQQRRDIVEPLDRSDPLDIRQRLERRQPIAHFAEAALQPGQLERLELRLRDMGGGIEIVVEKRGGIVFQQCHESIPPIVRSCPFEGLVDPWRLRNSGSCCSTGRLRDEIGSPVAHTPAAPGASSNATLWEGRQAPARSLTRSGVGESRVGRDLYRVPPISKH